MRMTALVADDEPLARRKLASLIADVPWLEQVGEAADGVATVAAAKCLRPDVILLDIEMPELSGVDVAARLSGIDPTPAVIFTTAYDRFAIAAFELGAVDYLLKPFGHRRFLAAVERARNALQIKAGAAALERMCTVFTGPSAATPLDRIFVRDGNSVLPLAFAEIERIEAQDDYVMVHTQRGRHLISLRMRDLEQRLPNPPFLRVHRSHIVNLDYVTRIAGLDDSRFEIHMKARTVVPVSRARSQEVRRLSR